MRRNCVSAGIRLLPLAGLLAGTLPATAAEEQGPAPLVNPVEVGIFGGVHFYEKSHGLGRNQSDNPYTSPDTGAALGLRLAYNLNEWIGAEAEFMFSPTKTRNSETWDYIFGYRAHLIATFIHTGYVRPFILLGAGAMTAMPDKYDSEGGQTLPRGRDTDGFYHFGLGAKFPLADNWGLRLDGRCLLPFSVLNDLATVGSETGYTGPDFEILASAYLGFGAEQPAPPPPPPPPPVDDDPDKDGIRGAADKCPTQPEDRDEFQDEDGCPDPDNDGDGILDKDDKCPNEAEDKDGFQDDDGCPDPDNDGDGILDNNDKCPNEPETVNNYQDADGCPDEIPEAVKKFTGVIQGINFKTNSDKILKGSHKVLDKAVQVLNDYPDVRLEVGGHTDNVGKAEYNLQLSQRRAESVRTYMVSKGISSDRLTAVGYGMDKPLTSNKTAKDKAKNRRTEFSLIGNK